jgi:superfamily II DNA or RNA helicase/prophage antirepressor-like protein
MTTHKTLNQAKGIEYENYVLNELRHEYDHIWLWKNVPEKILIDNKIIINYEEYSSVRKDIGVDIVAIKNSKYTYIQCKNYENNVCVNDISGFIFFMIMNGVDGTLCYSNDVSYFIKNQIAEKQELMKTKISLRRITFDNKIIKNPQNAKPHELRDYQKEAVEVLSKNKKCILAMPCGTGKTYTVSRIARNYDNVILLSPLRKLTHDILENMSIFLGKKYNNILISSDGTRDIEIINESLCEKNIIGCTYNSVDILVEIIDDLENVIVVVDEFHNLTQKNLTKKNDNMNILLKKCENIIYLSATPIYTVKHDAIFKYTWQKAIDEKIICDFNITIPSHEIIENENLKKMLILLKDVSIVDEKMIKKGYFLIRSLLLNGNKKCIIYLTTINKANIFDNIMRGFMKLLNIEFEIFVITNKTTKKNRDEFIYKFRANDVLSMILNVHILDEGIDIPECDSVYVTQPNNNIDNLIQRMCRCNRTTEKKKKCDMYIWSSEAKTKKLLEYITKNTYKEITERIQLFNPAKNKISNPNEQKKRDFNVKTKKRVETTDDVDNIDHNSELIIDIHKGLLTYNKKDIMLVIDNTNESWFNAEQVIHILEYDKTNEIIKHDISIKNKVLFETIKIHAKHCCNARGTSVFINHEGLCELVLQSKKPKVIEFKNWISNKVIPLIENNIKCKTNKESMTNTDLNFFNHILKYNDQNVYVAFHKNTTDPYFHANNVCKLLEYVDARDALRNHVDKKNIVYLKDIVTDYKPLYKNIQGHTKFLSKAGLYSLILKSKKETAKEITDWVTSEVMPIIKKQIDILNKKNDEKKGETIVLKCNMKKEV